LILLDTSGLLAAIDTDEPKHEAAATALRTALPPFLLSPFILAELDYLIGERLGETVQLDLLAEVSREAYRLATFDAADIAAARSVLIHYRGLGTGLADASVVVLAWRYRIQDVLTLDERHFRVLQGPDGPFRILPADV
jgi:uncharacterized protein